jgi:hypothetical protein
VASELPSSTTITRSTPSIRRAAETVDAIRAASSLAAMIAAAELAVVVGSMASGLSAA